MTRVVPGLAALLLSTSLASAGALDRTGQPVTVLFAEGNVAELSFGVTSPDVQGTFPGNGAGSGNVGVDFNQVALSFKYDISDRISVALILDQPFGADVDYDESEPGYPVAGSNADLDATGLTALGRYRLNDAFSLHAGVRFIKVEADLLTNAPVPVDATGAPLAPGGTPAGLGLYSYDGDFGNDTDVGFVLGGAYERPDIALRVALTYSSETSFSHATDYVGTLASPFGTSSVPGTGVTEYTLPQSVNLDVQTGIAADTLLFGSIRWTDWSETEINVPGYLLNPVVSYDDDYFTYTLGIGRRFSDRLSASASVIYEPSAQSDFDPATGAGGVTNLGPTNGQLGLQLAASYAVTDSLEVGGGLRYTRLGDASTRRIGGQFEDNDALSLGLRAAYRF